MSREDSGTELDLPPEHCHYRDEGCEFSSTCLNCMMPRCIHDQPGGRQQWMKRKRDEEMAMLFTADGTGIKELARAFGISQRTVQRALKRYQSTSSRQPFSSCREAEKAS